MTDRLDAWIHGGTLTRTSLARYRVLYAVVALLLLPDFSWIAAFPDSMYNPPPGPMMLFSGFPSEAVLRALEAALAVCFVALLVGWHTRAASFLAVVVSMVGYGFTYGLGKLDHDILLVLVPAAMALAGWGDRLSLDGVRRRSRGEADAPERAVQWPLRLWALMIGLAFFTAALPKILGGWLNPFSHAVQGIQIRQFYTHDRADLLASTFLGIKNPVFWEVMDIATIAARGRDPARRPELGRHPGGLRHRDAVPPRCLADDEYRVLAQRRDLRVRGCLGPRAGAASPAAFDPAGTLVGAGRPRDGGRRPASPGPWGSSGSAMPPA